MTRDRKRLLDRFDPRLIPFPSDKITLGDLRRVEHESFAWHALGNTGDNALAICEWEATLARNAFAQALGIKESNFQEKMDILYFVNSAYKDHRLSPGIQETRELIRRVEQAARAQAEQLLGKSR